ncbi:MAG TPA: FKBP-type peptidyl-prolyl cis-trans isomerase [Syntrophorhabdaceae bacterium]|nr:FKBP-type peptidyl-prolyl cis-trans isomerase [Syntrophorhabdaceae bacterium]
MSFMTRFLRNTGLTAIAAVSVLILASHVEAEERIPKEPKEKLGYSIGAQIGTDMKNFSIEIDPDMVAQGIKDAFAGKVKLRDEEIKAAMDDVNQEIRAKQTDKIKAISEKNKKDGELFLTQNEKASGVVKLPSGLQYKVYKEGSGKTPKADDTVVVHYKGTFIDGTEFDSSYKRNQPAEFKVNSVIPGWTEILQKMKVGSRYQIFIPSNLAYGDRGSGPIGPNAVLVFDVELLAIK